MCYTPQPNSVYYMIEVIQTLLRVWLGLGIQPCYEALDDLWVKIDNMQ